ncbi:glycosyltransferase [Oscillatoriales cyanobacterium LEGE 11467]|uniref:Glycosyltransferase n=1 Tax=Zarconia navalis LEGE 11467 TaxID=1828826 RepID=A0A928Z9E9_9CYAN|nr:glycosyltransferase [Zarconia navalis]MBE9041618.1 glycosyltransferase [Zarconia navalis LEGE 11467]
MNILMTAPALGSVYGGPSKSIVKLAEALGNQNLKVDLVATNANGNIKLKVPLQTWISKNKYRIRYFPFLKVKDYKISYSLGRWLFKNVKNYDLVQTNSIFSASMLPVYWACQKQDTPYIVTPRGMLEPWALSYKAWKKRIYYKMLEKPALNRASAIHLLASPEAEGVKVLNLKPPLFVIPNGIHSRDFSQLPNPNLFYQKFPKTNGKILILFLGRIDPKKGLDLLAPAFSEVRDRFPNAHLVIAGPDNIGFTSTARGYFAKTGCLESVTFTGMLEGQLKYAALAATSLYIAPSYSEGFSMSVLEGMASGLPCIITTGCNFPEAGVERAARVVNINSEEIANASIECLKNPEKAKEMGDRARKLIFNKYTWERISENLIEVFADIINQK